MQQPAGVTQSVTESLEPDEGNESLGAVVARHLTGEDSVVVEAGAGKDLLLNKNHVNQLSGKYIVLDPSELSSRRGNIYWSSEDTHLTDLFGYEGEKLYVNANVPDTIDTVREYQHEKDYDQELRDAMFEWTDYVKTLSVPWAISFNVQENDSYIMEESLSEEAYSDMLMGLDASREDVEEKEDSLLIMDYSK